jgi:signal transduction histidine kinase
LLLAAPSYFRPAMRYSKRFNTIRTLLITSILLTPVSAFITYYNLEQKKQTYNLVIQTYKVIQSSTTLLSHLKDMERGQRGYIVTGDSTFLQPYHEAEEDIDPHLKSLTALVSDNPRQLHLLKVEIEPLIIRKRTELDQSLSLFGKHGRDSASSYVLTRIGNAHMDSIRLLVNDLIDHEQGLLESRNERLEQIYFVNDTILFGSLALIGITALIALFTLQKKQAENESLIYELKELNLGLELKVKERTQQLEEEKIHVEKLNNNLQQNLEEVKALHEGLLDANKTLVKLNEEKNHFLGIATHDLKAPIAGIASLAQLMKLEGESDSRKLDYLEHIEDSCDRMQRLISDLLDINRIEHGSSSINLQNVLISKILARLYHQFKPIADRKNIILNFQNEVDEDVITTDQDALLQILDNLLSNAIKFSQAQKEVQLQVVTENGSIHFEVTDHGPGILPQEMVKVFGKFQKLSARPTAGEGSSGLGLSIVKELAHLLRGEVTVVSHPGVGTTFSVKLPSLK